jgi:hypothetical protein
MTEVKYDKSHHAGSTPEARIANRLRNSGDTANVDHVIQKGTGPTRTFTNIDHSRQHTHGPVHPGEGDIRGNKRGVV